MMIVAYLMKTDIMKAAHKTTWLPAARLTHDVVDHELDESRALHWRHARRVACSTARERGRRHVWI